MPNHDRRDTSVDDVAASLQDGERGTARKIAAGEDRVDFGAAGGGHGRRPGVVRLADRECVAQEMTG